MIEFNLPDDHCPTCQHELNAGTNVHTDLPIAKPGAIGICFYCGEILVLTDELRHRLPTSEEKLRVSLIPEIIEAQLMVRSK